MARLSGVSIRTLHHYDALGLLRPASVGENGYRLYGRAELLRLQQILFHRELGMPLADIAAVLDAPGFDRLMALRRQRAHADAEAARYRHLMATIDRTIADLTGEAAMADTELYEGFSPEKQAEYEAWIIDKYGEETRPHIEHGRKAVARMSEAERAEFMAEVDEIERDLGRAMGDGLGPDDARLDPILRRHHGWVARTWASPPTAEAYAGLGDLYVSHPDFVARYDAIRPGLADWMAGAMKAFAARAL